MAFKPPKATKAGGYRLSQEIDLNEAFKVDFSGNDALKEVIGQAILKHIRERTKAGTSINFDDNGTARFGNFKKYSDKYKNSPDFKSFGKSNDVDLTLSGDMLELMDFEIRGNKIVIGWDDSEQNAKAYNHQTGDTLPKRPFFGISKGELMALRSEFGDDLKQAIDVKKSEGNKAFNEYVQGLARGILEGDEDIE